MTKQHILFCLALALSLRVGAQSTNAQGTSSHGVAPSKTATDPDNHTKTWKLSVPEANDTTFAPLHWTNVDADFGPLPADVHVYRTNDSLQGRPNIAYYVSVPLKSKDLSFTDQVGYGKRYTPAQYFQQEGSPLLIINTSFFSFKTNGNLDVVVKDGKIVAWNQASHRLDSAMFGYYTRGALGIGANGKADIAWTFTDSTQPYPYAFEDGPVVGQGPDSIPSLQSMNNAHYSSWKMNTVIGGGPVLVYNGHIRVTNAEEWLFIKGNRDLNPRSAVGYTADGHLIVLAVQGRTPGIAEGVTLAQEAKLLQDLGCYKALNLDGGGSSCMLVKGKETIHPSDKEGERPVPAVFLITHKK